MKLRISSGRALMGLVLALPILLPAPVVAQRGHQPLNNDEQVKILAKNLDLDETQQLGVKKILEQRQRETLRLRHTSISGSVRIDRFRALQDMTVQRIRAVLNDEQRRKYDPLAVRKVGPAKDQKTVEDWLELTTRK